MALAFVPTLTGMVADATVLAFALFVPALRRTAILAYGLHPRRPRALPG